MRKYLLPQGGNFYKANLHCHSDYSDGKLSPLELKQLYMKNGYSVIALTDHDILLEHPELNDDSFLTLNGYELEISESGKKWPDSKTCHLCFISMSPDNITQVCWHKSKYLFSNSIKHQNKVKFDQTLADFEREYTPACINDMIRIGRENGFFVTYNHPSWSLEDYRDYSNYNGMNAMEIVNFSCCMGGYDDHNGRVYDDMLRSGKRIFCIAADDNHNTNKSNTPKSDSCGAYVMIKAERLEYSAITWALDSGEFYSSQGPEITALWAQKDEIHIECSTVREIALLTGNRSCQLKTEGNKGINASDFKLNGDEVYFRIEAVGFDGKKAYTNAYFLDNLRY